MVKEALSGEAAFELGLTDCVCSGLGTRHPTKTSPEPHFRD